MGIPQGWTLEQRAAWDTWARTNRLRREAELLDQAARLIMIETASVQTIFKFRPACWPTRRRPPSASPMVKLEAYNINRVKLNALSFAFCLASFRYYYCF